MNAHCAVIVFAKAPVPGTVKTRLIPAIGDVAAARLAARMLRETVRQAVQAEIGPVELCCAPDCTHPDFLALRDTYGVTLTQQGDGDLGGRMHRALARTLQQHPCAVLIGTDAPQLDADLLRHAARLLRSQPAVFAPAADGGYVLVGLTQAQPSLFAHIAWSTDQVMHQTRVRLAALGINGIDLPTLHDVDEPDDLVHVPDDWWR